MFQLLGGERKQRSSGSSRVENNRSGQCRTAEPGRADRRPGAPHTFLFPAAALIGGLSCGLIFGLAGCGGNTAAKATTPLVSIVMNQAPPASVQPSGTFKVSAVVSNDPSNEGVDWQLICSYNTQSNTTNSGTCGTISPAHTASGATATYTAPVYYPGGTATLYARATANGTSEATSTFTIPSNFTIVFTQPPPATMVANSQTYIYATLPGATGLNITYSLSCGSTAEGGCGWLSGWGLDSRTDTSGDPVLYIAPAEVPPQDVVITASVENMPSIKTTASTTIQALPLPPVTVQLTDPGANGSLSSSISVGHALMIGANVANDETYSGVDWSLSCTDTAGTGCGSLSAAHSASNTQRTNYPLTAGIAYTAPAKVPSGGKVIITAASTLAPSITVSKTFTINPANSLGLNGLLEGQFAFVLSGRDTYYDKTTANYGGYYAIAGSLIGDGKGNVSTSESDVMYFKLGITPTGCGYGTYAIGLNGHGQITLNSCGEPYSTLDVDFIDADHAVLTEADGIGTGTGMLIRQNLNDVATALSPTGVSLNGNYTLTLNGANRENPTETLFLGGALTATPTSGGLSTETSFVGDADYAGSTVTNASATTQPTLGSSYDAYGRTSLGTVDLGASIFQYGTSSLQTLTAYMVDKNHYIVIQDTDNFSVTSGYLTAQPASPSISGGYAFTEAGVSASNAPMAAGGVFTCGSTGTMDVTTQGGTPQSKESIQASCTAPSNGRGLVSVIGTTGGISKFAAYPTTDMGLQLVEIDNNGPTGAGVAWPQQTAAISASTLNGVYASDLLINNTAGLESVIAPISADGVSSVSSTSGSQQADTSQLTLSTSSVAKVLNTPLTGTYSADASGRFSGSLNLASSTLGTEYYVADAGRTLLMATDAANPGTGIMLKQSLPLFLMGAATPKIGQAGVAYNSGALLQFTGGAMPFTYTLTSGTLPAGLTLGASTGTITGTTTVSGAYPITVKLTDATGATVSANVTFYIESSGGVTVNFSPAPPSAMGLQNPISIAAVLSGDYTGLGIDWSVSCSAAASCGSFSPAHTASGEATIFTANASLPAGTVVTVTAASTADATRTASAQITVSGIAVSMSTLPTLLTPGGTLPLTATVTGDAANAGVNWTLSCQSTDCGSIPASSASGVIVNYTAPAVAPKGNNVTITASSVTVPSVAVSNALLIAARTPNGLLKGQSVILIKGQNASSEAHTLIGTLIGDGNGNFTDAYVRVNGDPSGNNYSSSDIISDGGSATYSLDASGRGTITIEDYWAWGYSSVDLPGGQNCYNIWDNADCKAEFSVTFVTPQHAVLSEIDGWGTAVGTLDVQNATDLQAFENKTEGLNGTYSANWSGVQAGAATNYPAGLVDNYYLGSALSFTFNGGATTETGAVMDEVVLGVLNQKQMSSPPALSLSVDSYGYVNGMSKVDFGSGSAKFTLDTVMIDASHFAVAGWDASRTHTFAGYLVAQPASATMTGNYAFTANGWNASATSQAVGGTFTCGGDGAVDVGGATSPLTAQAVTVNCSALTAGRGTITITGADSAGVKSYAVYPTVGPFPTADSYATISQSWQLIELDGGASGTAGGWGAGTAYTQTLTSPSVADITGSYATLGHFASNTADEINFTGLLTADGTSSLTGTVDETSGHNSTVTTNTGASLSGTFTTGTGDRFPLSPFTITNLSSNALDGVLYILDSNNVLLLETDPTSPGAGSLQLQQPLLQ